MLKGITSKHNGDFYCLNCFHSDASKEALEKHTKVYENKGYCYIEMPKKGESLKYQPGVKSMRGPFAIYTDSEYLLKKMDTCTNHPSKSSTTQKNKNVIDYYRGKDLRKQTRLIVDCEKKEMIKVTQKEQYKHDTRKCCFICKKHSLRMLKIIILKEEIILIILENIEVLHIKYVI